MTCFSPLNFCCYLTRNLFSQALPKTNQHKNHTMNSEGVVAMKNFRSFLRIEPVNRFEHLSFNLLSFYFFKNSEIGIFLFFRDSQILTPLIVIPYIFASEVIHFRTKRYFVEFKGHVVGIFALKEKAEALYISCLVVNPENRRLGIGTYALIYAERLAERMRKKWIELSVLKANTPARRLYRKFGFTEKEETKWSFILKKKS